MISYDEFRNIFGGMGFKEGELKSFYFSIRKSLILVSLGKRSWPDLIKIEEQYQWPVLQRIADPELSIYHGADSDLLARFINTISEEKDIRERRGREGKIPHWTRLRSLLEDRTELFKHIFNFSADDIRRCEAVAERYSRILEKKMRNRKKIWRIGIGAGAATLAGAAIWYVSKKEKDSKGRHGH